MQPNHLFFIAILPTLCLTAPQLLYADGATNTPEPDKVAVIAVQNPDTAFLDQLATGGIPAAIGELLGAQADAMGALFTSAAKTGTLSVDLIARKQIADKVAGINQNFGRMLAVLDVGGKVYAGDYGEATWSVGYAGLTELAGSQAGKSALAYVGCTTTAPVTAAILAIQIYRESAKQVVETKGAVVLESLYGSVESMVRDRGRKLGDASDPFPVDSENVEKIWRRILSDGDFRGKFALYVTDVLNRTDWPAAGFFDRMQSRLATVGTDNSSEHGIEVAAQEKLLEEKDTIKTYIAGLISTLNRAAKKEEARVMAQKALQDLQRYFKSNGASMEEGMTKMCAALKRMPEAIAWSQKCGAQVDQAIKEKSTDSLSAERAMITMYVRDVIRWIPATGSLGSERNKVYASLRSAYEKSLVATGLINKEREEKIKNPTVPKGDFKGDPVSYFASYFQKVIKPYDWDDSGGPGVFKAKLKAYFEAGQFKGPRDISPLPEGRAAKADLLMEAWSKENFDVINAEGSFSLGNIPTPAIEKTISAYSQAMQEEINKILTTSPPYADGSAKNAFIAAAGMAREASGNQAALAKSEFEQTSTWMSALHQQYLDYASSVWAKATDINTQFAGFGCTALGSHFANTTSSITNHDPLYKLAPDAKNDNLTFTFAVMSESPAVWQTDGKKTYGGKYVSLDEASSLLSGQYSQSGIGKMSEQSGSLLNEAVTYYLDSQANRYAYVAAEIRQNYAGVVSTVNGLCETYESNAQFWDKILSDAQSQISEIRKFYDPQFLDSESFAYFKARRSDTPKWVSQKKSLAAQMASQSEQVASEWDSDAAYLRSLSREFAAWIDSGTQEGILGQSGSYDSVGKLNLGGIGTDGIDGVSYRYKPYPHMITQADRSSLIAKMKGGWENGGLAKFAQKSAPWLQKIIADYIGLLSDVKTLDEENFLTSTSQGTTMMPITPTKLTKAEDILAKMTPGTPAFDESFSSLISTLPLQIDFPGVPSKEKFRDISAECLKAPLAPRYVALRENVKEALKSHRAQAGAMASAQSKKQLEEARGKLPGLLSQLKARLAEDEELIQKSLEATALADLDTAITKLNHARADLTTAPYPDATSLYHVVFASSVGADGKTTDSLAIDAGKVINGIGSMSGSINAALDKLDIQKRTPQDASSEVAGFYDDFKKAYEYKQESKVMSFIGDKWTAGDGTGLMELEDYLRNSFTVFDQIKYAISNLKAVRSSENIYKVRYDLVITGKIYDANIKHEEKSSVVEEVTVDSSGRKKITKTLEGKFWYIK